VLKWIMYKSVLIISPLILWVQLCVSAKRWAMKLVVFISALLHLNSPKFIIFSTKNWHQRLWEVESVHTIRHDETPKHLPPVKAFYTSFLKSPYFSNDLWNMQLRSVWSEQGLWYYNVKADTSITNFSCFALTHTCTYRMRGNKREKSLLEWWNN